MKYSIFAIFSMIIMIACSTGSYKDSKNDNDMVSYKTKLVVSLNSIPYYQCDDYSAFNIEPRCKVIDSLYHGILQCTKEPLINTYDSTIVDTIYTYSNKLNKIVIYKAIGRELLSLYDVSDTVFEINGKIKPGISKDMFCRKFNINGLTQDTVDVGDLEQAFVVRFYFKANILKRIKTEPYLD